jgi:hypothetical protein
VEKFFYGKSWLRISNRISNKRWFREFVFARQMDEKSA